MCGIAGHVNIRGGSNLDLVRAMINAQKYRGPDDEGIWLSRDGVVAFGHARLSVIDLSKAAAQPMVETDGDLAITYNGEIYNFRELREELLRLGFSFSTNSDTEVLLRAYQAWGADLLDRIDGMFAFCIYDGRLGRLLLARDRAGEKPLYYQRLEGGGLLFSSELRPLLSVSSAAKSLDSRALDNYLAYGYSPSDQSLVAGIRKVPPAHLLEIDLLRDNSDLRCYWNIPDSSVSMPSGTVAEYVEELEQKLTDSVRVMLNSDVPLGILLSGGVDSSLITAIAARLADKPIRTFTVSFKNQGRFDEGPHARIVSDHFGTEHTELIVEPDSLDSLPDFLGRFDEPIASHSVLPLFLLTNLVRQHVTVALGGDGGDELFCGYPHYRMLLRQQRLREALPAPLRDAITGLGKWVLPVGLRGRNYVLGLDNGYTNGIAHTGLYFDCFTRSRILRRDTPPGDGFAWDSPEKEKMQRLSRTDSLIQGMMTADFEGRLANNYLVKLDRSSMMNSLELRAPFLSRSLIEFAFSRVPDALRVTASGGKILPKMLAEKLLPEQLEINRKQGFTMPLDAWSSGHSESWWSDTLQESMRFLGGFDGDASWARRFGMNFTSNQRFALIFLFVWAKANDISISRP